MQQVYVARESGEKHHMDEKTGDKWVEGEMVV